MKLLKKGKRLDGRSLKELRSLKAEAGFLSRADGSGSFSFGKTKAVAAVHGPRELHPKHLERPRKALLRCRYLMAPFSTEERSSPGPSRRSQEISKLLEETLSGVVNLEQFPKAAIDCFVRIVSADSSTRCAALNAVAIALADSGVEMRSLVSAVSIGKIDGKLVVDVAGKEDMEGEADIPMAWIPSKDELAFLQFDGKAGPKEILKSLKLGKEACKKVWDVQCKALRAKFK